MDIPRVLFLIPDLRLPPVEMALRPTDLPSEAKERWETFGASPSKSGDELDVFELESMGLS